MIGGSGECGQYFNVVNLINVVNVINGDNVGNVKEFAWKTIFTTSNRSKPLTQNQAERPLITLTTLKN